MTTLRKFIERTTEALDSYATEVAALGGNVTPWFLAHVKPVRAGWYEVKGSNLRAARFYFDGKFWRGKYDQSRAYAWPLRA